MKEITLTQGKVTLVNDDDFEELNKYNWCAHHTTIGSFYAVKRPYITMHRFILGLKKGDGKHVDHINHNTLDNRRSNIRIVTIMQNAMNRKKIKNKTSCYKGVCWHKSTSKWHCQIHVNKKRIHLGYFENEIEAAKTYDIAANKHFREYAHLNFGSK